jgi:hypothetical protein
MSDDNRKKGGVMTLQDMEAQFDSEWILVGDPQTNESLEVVQGTVLCHSKDRDEVYSAAVKLGLKHIAVLYTGKMSPDEDFVL